MGHSQGGRVALEVAKNTSGLYALGLLSAGREGRFAAFITKELNDAKAGKQTMEKAYENIEGLYDQWKEICSIDENDEDLTKLQRDPAKTWKSFSYPSWTDLIHITIPVYIAYGTADHGAAGNALMPVYFELTGKKNYKMKPYINRGHNFEKIINETPDFNDMKWQEVMDDFIQWVEAL